MKLSDFVRVPLMESLANMDLIDYKVHTDCDGEIRSVELKYEPKDSNSPSTKEGKNLFKSEKGYR